MERKTSRVFLASLLIMFGSVVNQTRADQCSVDGLGTCENCDQKCKDKHGPSSEGSCDRSVGVPLCRCYYGCSPPSPPPPPSPPSPIPPKTCDGGAGLCSESCPENCCDTNCAQKYNGGHGFCNTLGNVNLCQCEYPC